MAKDQEIEDTWALIRASIRLGASVRICVEAGSYVLQIGNTTIPIADKCGKYVIEQSGRVRDVLGWVNVSGFAASRYRLLELPEPEYAWWHA